MKTITTRKRTIIVGLKSDNFSREMLLRLLHFFVQPADILLAVHVQDPNDTFDPNTFHMHEDLCKSKQVEFHIKVCVGSSYAAELSNQVRLSFATSLVIGCSSYWPGDASVLTLSKSLPPSCNLLVIDRRGKIVLQKQGTSQQGSLTKLVHSSASPTPSISRDTREKSRCHLQKSFTMPNSSISLSPGQSETAKSLAYTKRLSFPDVTQRWWFERLATLEMKGTSRRYSLEELKWATNNFSAEMLIGEGGHSKVYRACLADGHAAAVKVLNPSQHSEDDLFQEVEILNGLKHENIVQLLGFCYCKDMQAVVYNLLKQSLKHSLSQLTWCERMRLAIEIAKALDYLHSSSPPVIHRDVKSSNILLSESGQPQLSDFGAAVVLDQNHQTSGFSKPIHVVGTFGYLAPEYMMYGKVDEKIDVYSYGVVLLELITGKEAIQRRPMSTQESLVLWARSLLTSGLSDRLIDPDLKNEYDKDEMSTMMIVAKLCLLHSSSRRPTTKMILHLLEEPGSWVQHTEREELQKPLTSGSVSELSRHNGSDFGDTIFMDDGELFTLS